MKNTPILYPIRFCTGGCKNPGHKAHVYSIDPIDGALSAAHLCPGNADEILVEELDEETQEKTGWGHMAEPSPLLSAALNADSRLDRVISTQFPGKTRWTLSPDECAHLEVESAYRAKVKADKAWLDALSGKPSEPAKGLSLDNAKAHLAERAKEGACGLSWDEIERKQGGKLTR